jgi:hypothetical protein
MEKCRKHWPDLIKLSEAHAVSCFLFESQPEQS